MNERWRFLIAGLVAALAIPILVIDSPSIAEGVVESAATEAIVATPSTLEQPAASDDPADELVTTQVVTATSIIRPDVVALVARASAWGLARAAAIEEGLVAAAFVPPPSDTNLSLLPVVSFPDAEPEPQTEPEKPVADAVDPPEPDVPAEPPEGSDPDPTPAPAEGEGDTADDAVPPTPAIPAPPAQVNGRVPPPEGGPTAEQWNALRRCESTHSYHAISSSGLYRGAYQFSQQTWDWVAGIHYPFLVGLDPAEAAPGWQDVMAYTLYAMRGWDQWPICGKNLV